MSIVGYTKIKHDDDFNIKSNVNIAEDGNDSTWPMLPKSLIKQQINQTEIKFHSILDVTIPLYTV